MITYFVQVRSSGRNKLAKDANVSLSGYTGYNKDDLFETIEYVHLLAGGVLTKF
jgi:hypothetical protein